MSIGENIKQYRKGKMTQKELAKKLKKSERMIQKYENEEVTPSFDMLNEIATALGVYINDLIGFEIKENITLKNINLKGITFQEQQLKVKEENEEFEKAILKRDIDNAIEEFWDSMQSKLGLLEYIGVDADEVMVGYPKHLEKIKNRPRKK